MQAKRISIPLYTDESVIEKLFHLLLSHKRKSIVVCLSD